MQLAEMLDDLPKHGDWGVRFDERGRKQRWKGYKLHCDLSDSGLPLSYVLTSASCMIPKPRFRWPPSPADA